MVLSPRTVPAGNSRPRARTARPSLRPRRRQPTSLLRALPECLPSLPSSLSPARCLFRRSTRPSIHPSSTFLRRRSCRGAKSSESRRWLSAPSERLRAGAAVPAAAVQAAGWGEVEEVGAWAEAVAEGAEAGAEGWGEAVAEEVAVGAEGWAEAAEEEVVAEAEAVVAEAEEVAAGVVATAAGTTGSRRGCRGKHRRALRGGARSLPASRRSVAAFAISTVVHSLWIRPEIEDRYQDPAGPSR